MILLVRGATTAGVYSTLALTGLKNNKHGYLVYLLTSLQSVKILKSTYVTLKSYIL